MSTAVSSPVRAGMGAIPHEHGVAFRVWAPHAERVDVVGSFNDWKAGAAPMQAEERGYWAVDVAEAKAGDEYRFLIHRGEQQLSRIDPYAREVTNSVGNGVVYDPRFDWEGDSFQLPSWNELVIYELHVGTFARHDPNEPGEFDAVVGRFEHLRRLGVNAIEIMPTAEFAGDVSWGYNPAHIFAVESAYGGPNALKEFVKQAHREGFAVLLDVVYNHFGPSDLHLWQFDGWSEHGLGGIYFYNDWRADTPWGQSRPDYGRGEVRQFIRDNALMWLDEFHIDGLRWDMTLFVRTVSGDGNPGRDLPDGWSLTQWINREIHERFPGRITIAEDLQNVAALTGDVQFGGAGFGSQWDAGFVHPIRSAITAPDDAHRNMHAVRDALCHRYNIDSFERVIYTESHDEVANGKARVPSEINPDDPDGVFAQRRSAIGAALVFTAPGIPMIFQGQEFLQPGWFQDTQPLDWRLAKENDGALQLYRDLIRLRTNREGCTRGLCGQHIQVHLVDDGNKLIAFHRWDQGGPGDDVVVVVNFSHEDRRDVVVGVPREGVWRVRLDSNYNAYVDEPGASGAAQFAAVPQPAGGYPHAISVRLGPYSALVLSQDRPQTPAG